MSDDTTDAVADCFHSWFLGEFLAYCRLCKLPYHRSTRVHELEARIDDLEAKLAAVTQLLRDAQAEMAFSTRRVFEECDKNETLSRALYDATRERDAQKRALDAVRAIDANCNCGSTLCDKTLLCVQLQRELDSALALAEGT